MLLNDTEDNISNQSSRYDQALMNSLSGKNEELSSNCINKMQVKLIYLKSTILKIKALFFHILSCR